MCRRRCGSSPQLLPDRERVLGRDHPDTLTTRRQHRLSGPARWATRARRCDFHRELLPDQERVLGRDHPDTLTTRNNIAFWTGEVGDAREALRLLPRAAAGPGAGAGPRPPRHAHHPQQHRVLDRRSGRRAEALRLLPRLLPDQERVLGRDHPDTLSTRSNIAYWTGEVGDAPRGAATVPRAAAGPGAGAGPRPPRHAHHPQQHRVLDRRGGRRARGAATVHASCCRTRSGCWAATTPTRSPPATTSRHWTGEAGDAPEALRLFTELLPDQERVLGRDHPDTLTTRTFVGIWAIKNGDQQRVAGGCARD